jgi:hypothetical protein
MGLLPKQRWNVKIDNRDMLILLSTEQLGYKKDSACGKPTENRRKGKPNKTLWIEQGAMEIEVPRG